MSELRTKIDSFILSVSKHINALNAAITGKVNTQTFNNQTLQFQTELYTLTTDLNTTIQTLETFKGLHFVADQASSLISLKNEAGTTITEINVGFLNNEGTKFVYNTTTQKLELRNDANELLSEIALNNFISNIANTLSFNSQTPHTLELKNSNGTVSSFVNIGIQNIQGLEQRFNTLKNIYNGDDMLTGNRTVALTDKYLRFTSNTDNFEFKDNKLTIPQLFTNKFGATQSGQVLTFILNNNLPKITFGNNDINELEVNSKKYIFKNVPIATNQNKTLSINDAGEIAAVDGLITNYIAGDGITINGNIISLTPADQISLVFNW